jgi:glycosyltransferase involved in cell wall biosynthesis
MKDNISFSIVVATQGRVELLKDLINSIDKARRNYSGDCEVVLIDDSSAAESEEIQKACDQYDCKYFFYENAVSAKRNYGVQMASNEIILFLDSDCIATENILNDYAEHYADINVAAAAGPLEFVGPNTWFWKAIEASPFVTCFILPKYLATVEWGVTANFSVRRSVFLQVGGFDESFPRPAGEDVDLGLRIKDAGYEIHGANNALVYHSKKTWIPFKATMQRFKYYGAADCHLITKHPEHSVLVLPRRVLTYVITLILLILFCIVQKSAWMLLSYPLLLLGENVSMSVLVNRIAKNKQVSFSQQMMAQLLIHNNEYSYMSRCLATGNFKALSRQMIYYLGQYRGMLTIGSISCWVTYLLLASVLLIVGIGLF